MKCGIVVTALLLLLSGSRPVKCFSDNIAPGIGHVTCVKDEANKALVVTYDLKDPENDTVMIAVKVKSRKTGEYLADPIDVSGDLGYPVLSGTGKKIVWKYGSLDINDHTLTLIADDLKPVDLAGLAKQVDSTRLKQLVGAIYGNRHRVQGLQHLRKVKGSIEQNFVRNALRVTKQEFTYEAYQAHNIIGYLPGVQNQAPRYIICAHFDTSLDSPGADDNASGIAGLLEAMHILAQYSFSNG